MNLKQCIYFQWSMIKKSLMWYYGIFILVLTSLLVLMSVTGGNMSGTEFNSYIFIFVVGIVTWKEHFHFLQQNGISRKTQTISFLLTALITSTIISIIDIVLGRLLMLFAEFHSLAEMTFESHADFLSNPFVRFPSLIIWSTLFLCIAMLVGQLIGALNYRMNRLQRTLFYVGVPAFFVVILPTIDAMKFNSMIYRSLAKAIAFTTGFSPQSGIFISIGCFACILLVLSGIYMLLTRRVTIR